MIAPQLRFLSRNEAPRRAVHPLQESEALIDLLLEQLIACERGALDAAEIRGDLPTFSELFAFYRAAPFLYPPNSRSWSRSLPRSGTRGKGCLLPITLSSRS